MVHTSCDCGVGFGRMKLKGRMDLVVLVGIALAILVALIFTTLQLLDQSEQHVKKVQNTRVETSPVNTFYPRANECDRQAKADFEHDPNRTEARYNNFSFSEEGFKQFGRSKTLTRLQLIDCDAKDEWLRHITKLPLTFLAIEGTDLTSASLPYIAKIETLSTLGLARDPIKDENMEELLKLTKLTGLNISETDLTAAGIKTICKNQNLVTLSVMGCPTTGDCFEDIGKVSALTILDVGQIAHVTPEQLRNLQNLKRLYKLNMRRCDLTDDCLKELSQMTSIHELEIDSNIFTDSGLEHLKALKNLRTLRIHNCRNITPAGVERLRKALPSTAIETKFTSAAGIDLGE